MFLKISDASDGFIFALFDNISTTIINGRISLITDTLRWRLRKAKYTLTPLGLWSFKRNINGKKDVKQKKLPETSNRDKLEIQEAQRRAIGSSAEDETTSTTDTTMVLIFLWRQKIYRKFKELHGVRVSRNKRMGKSRSLSLRTIIRL